MILEQIAQIAHEINAAYCKSIGDVTQLEWRELPADLQLVVIRGVQFQLANPGQTPESTHVRWMNEMIQQGWTKGKMSIESKQHPCLVPYEQLPVTEQSKTYLFLQTVNSLRTDFN